MHDFTVNLKAIAQENLKFRHIQTSLKLKKKMLWKFPKLSAVKHVFS